MEARGLEVTFTSKDVYNKLCVSAVEKAFDASGFLEKLRERQQNESLFCRYTEDEDGCLDKVFYVMAGANEIYAADLENNIAVFDTKARALHSLSPFASIALLLAFSPHLQPPFVILRRFLHSLRLYPRFYRIAAEPSRILRTSTAQTGMG